MKPLAPIRVLVTFALALCARAEVIDRIAVSVGYRVITQSDLEREIRVIALQNGVQPDLSSVNRRAVAEKMIQQKLIESELESSRYPRPTPDDLMPAIEDFKKSHFKDDAEYRHALAEYGVTEPDLLDVLVWERTLLSFIEIRFETGVQVSEQDVEAYARQNKVTAEQAEKILTSQRADEQVEQWLRDVRRRTEVVVHEEVFR